MAATPLTNSVSPTGRISTEPAARVIARACTNTVATMLWPLRCPPVTHRANSASRAGPRDDGVDRRLAERARGSAPFADRATLGGREDSRGLWRTLTQSTR